MNKTTKFLIDLIGFAVIMTFVLYMLDSKAAYIEFKKNGRIHYIYDDILKKSFYLKDAPRQYLAAKSQGNVVEKELNVSDYKYNPKNLRRSQLKKKLNDSDLNLVEVNEYLRLMR